MILFILIQIFFALPLAIDRHCYDLGYCKQFSLYLGSTWIGFFLCLNRIKKPDISIILFFSWLGVSYLLNPYKSGDPLEALIIYTCYLVIYLAAKEHFTINNLTMCLEILSYILFILFLYDYWGTFVTMIKTHYYSIITNRYKGNFGQSGIYGSWLAMAMPILLIRRRWIACFIGVFLLWLTGSRASIIGLGLAILVLVYIKIKTKWAKYTVSALILILLALLIYVFFPKVLSDQTERLSYWNSTVNIIYDNPITGWGIGSFRIHYPKYRESCIFEIFNNPNIDLLQAHSMPLQMISELGIIGIILFIFMLYRHLKSATNWGLIAAVFACIMINITDITFYYVPIGFMLFIYLGLMAKKKENI